MKVFLALAFVCGLALVEARDYRNSEYRNRDSGEEHPNAYAYNKRQWNNPNSQSMPLYDQKMMGFSKNLAHIFGYESKQPYYYNPSTKPDHKVPIEVSLYVRMLGPVHVEKNFLEMQLTYRESYYDKRLKNMVQPFGHRDFVTLTGEDVNMLWTPDTFFRNTVDEEFMGSIKPNQYARVFPDGKVLVSRRVNLKVACPHMEEKFSSNEEAKCKLTLASYGFKKDDLHYKKAEEDALKLTEHATTYLGKYNDVPISIEAHEIEEGEVETATGMYSLLHFNFGLMAKNR